MFYGPNGERKNYQRPSRIDSSSGFPNVEAKRKKDSLPLKCGFLSLEVYTVAQWVPSTFHSLKNKHVQKKIPELNIIMTNLGAVN